MMPEKGFCRNSLTLFLVWAFCNSCTYFIKRRVGLETLSIKNDRYSNNSHWTRQPLFEWICVSVWDCPGFPGSSAGKESTCNAGDPDLIPGLGRSSGEGIGYPLQYSWASQEAQTVKNLPAMWETWVWSLGWEGPLEEGMATHSSILAWRIPMDRGAWQAAIHRVAKSQTLSD